MQDVVSDLYSVRCENCGHKRSDDLFKPCENCKSKHVRGLGYVYGFEADSFLRAVSIFIAVLILLLVVFCVYLYYTIGVLRIFN